MAVIESGTKADKGPGKGPGKAKKRGRLTPRGRQVQPEALEDVRSLLADRPRRRDLLIEHLHLIQDHFGHLSAAHLAALAEEMRLPQAEVYEVATFYAHFDVVKEGETAPPPLTIRVCDSLPCAMRGAERLKSALEDEHDPRLVRVVRAPCMGRCAEAPALEIGHRPIDHATVDAVRTAVDAGVFEPDLPAFKSLDAYRAEGGYRVLEACRRGERDIESVTQTLLDSGLRGLGGAGFPTGRKWGLVLSEPAPRYAAVNADEGEPGTFKDRYYLETDPHRFLEGALIGAWAVEAERLYIYLRDEYPGILKLLRQEIARLEAEGIVAPGYIDLRRGAGAYICGEESAMIESIEGKRGLPRHRPPYVAQRGIFDRPTLVNNVETLYWVPLILENGAEWFAGLGRHGGKGLRSYSVSGRVREPGVKVAPAGITVRELIDEFCGGMEDGHALKAFLPGGASGGIMPATMADLSLDFGVFEKHGGFIGSHAVIILSEQDDIPGAALNLMRFFEDESCGQCTPCRAGTEKAVKLMQRSAWDKPLLDEVSDAMTDASICGLGQAASNPLRCAFKYFGDDVRTEPKAPGASS